MNNGTTIINSLISHNFKFKCGIIFNFFLTSPRLDHFGKNICIILFFPVQIDKFCFTISSLFLIKINIEPIM